MGSGEQSGSLNASDLELQVYGQPVSPELAKQQYDALSQQLRSAGANRDEYMVENIRNQMALLEQAVPSLAEDPEKPNPKPHHETGNWWEAL